MTQTTKAEEDFAVLIKDIRKRFDKAGLPPRYWNAVANYVRNGDNPGRFLRAVFENNLALAATHADDTNAPILHTWGRFLSQAMPSIAVGSSSKVHRWASLKGFIGSLRNRDLVVDGKRDGKLWQCNCGKINTMNRTVCTRNGCDEPRPNIGDITQ